MLNRRGKRLSKYFERPEGTQKDLAELDVMRNCACSFLQHESLMAENMLAASHVQRFYSRFSMV